MANYLDAHPDEVEYLTWWRTHGNGRMVPIAQDGEFGLLVAHQHMDCFKPDASITVEDYVVGLELLGYTFRLIRMEHGRLGLMHNVGLAHVPAAWGEYAELLCEAFGRGRDAEVRDFLLARGDGVVGDDASATEPVQ